MKKGYALLLYLLLLLLFPLGANAQLGLKTNPDSQQSAYDDDEYDNTSSSSHNQGSRRSSWGRDTTENKSDEIPIGVHQWTVEERLGTIVTAENLDTAVHMFQYFNETTGYNGEYNILGNLASPRLSRIFLHRENDKQLHQFLEPYSFLLGGIRDFRFSNTLSPLTNLAYHKVGNTQNGQERLHAYFATNINKSAGIGMRFDYLLGRGYYNSQANSQFGGTLFGYYLGERYQMHSFVNYNHLKMAENGGIENDAYIRDPQSFPRRYGSKDIPTNLSDTWNRNDNEDAYLTHRFNLGYNREIEVPDSLKPKMPNDGILLSELNDSIRQIIETDSLLRITMLDSLKQSWKDRQLVPKEFVPVASIIHTIRVNNLRHTYYSYNTPSGYYTNQYYGSLSNVRDRTKSLSVRNTLGLALREGFKKWVQMGMTAFLTHELRTNTLPQFNDTILGRQRYTENNIFVGGEISRTQGDLLHYNAVGEFVVIGDDVGEFSVDGNINLNLPIGKKDTLEIEAIGSVSSEEPDFYFRHYHSQFHWWDNSLSREFRSRVEGVLRLRRIGTEINVGFENLKNFTYYAMQNTLTGDDPTSVLSADYSHSVSVCQSSANIQVFSATLRQNLHVGPLHWDNDVTYQTSSKPDILPLPKLSLYSNLYFQFRIAKVLNVQAGGDIRYFTRYYAPDYSPAIQQYAVQDVNNPRVRIGNYPIVNAYVNLHIKRCRLYVAMTHLNAGTGRMFWAPHYPMDPRTFHFGISWNFFN